MEITFSSERKFHFQIRNNNSELDDIILYKMNKLQESHSNNWNQLIQKAESHSDYISKTLFSSNVVIGLSITSFVLSIVSIISIVVMLKFRNCSIPNRQHTLPNTLYTKPSTMQLNTHKKYKIIFAMSNENFNSSYCGTEFSVRKKIQFN